MFFSEYAILEKPGLITDPLGLSNPYSRLQDKLFRQFTVLSNYPAYHGALCLFYQMLERQGITPSRKDFAQKFRELEICWGLIHACAPSTSILNVTKYANLIQGRERISLSDIPKGHDIYRRLGYGTLGHYSGPSVEWGLLGKGGKTLTALGRKLADAFGERNESSGTDIFKRWLSGKAISISEFGEARAFRLDRESRSRQEAGVWQEVIATYCDAHPRTKTLWTAPLTNRELEKLHESASTYDVHCMLLAQRYDMLGSELSLIRQFEQMSATIQFLFELEYVACGDAAGNGLVIKEVSPLLVKRLTDIAAQYVNVPEHIDPKGMFAGLARLRGSREVTDFIVHQHQRHQRAKQVSPFIFEGRTVIADRYDSRQVARMFDDVCKHDDIDRQQAELTFRYRRDWHFGRASRYQAYAEAP